MKQFNIVIDLKSVSLMLITLPLWGSLFAKQPAWPTEEQRAFVQKRLETFPRQTLVKDVDWYQPQEAVTGGNAATFEPLATPTISPDRLAKAKALIEAKDSYAFLVWRNGKLEHEYYAAGFDRKSRYESASMAKTVVALAVGVAVDRGMIQSIDDPAEKYISTMKASRRGAVALRDYLQMTSTFESPSPTSGTVRCQII